MCDTGHLFIVNNKVTTGDTLNEQKPNFNNILIF